MRIEDALLEPFCIEVEDQQWTLIEKVTKGTTEKSKKMLARKGLEDRAGEIREVVQGHYTDFQTLLKKVVKMIMLRQENSSERVLTLREYIDEYKYLQEEIKQILI